ncbi:unnamed protein product [Echinostoma caproni]|uniref:DUF1716 domain-containing protein n=1 Tax=Echinostoma caproni TaxID=27848 RepID=A0A183AGZ2_9TREM|nr:unnamed protein product [Echinostoma caproni]
MKDDRKKVTDQRPSLGCLFGLRIADRLDRSEVEVVGDVDEESVEDDEVELLLKLLTSVEELETEDIEAVLR